MKYPSATLYVTVMLFMNTVFSASGEDISGSIEKNSSEALGKLIKENPEAVNRKISEKGMPLDIAVSRLKVDIVKLLLEKGANVKYKDPETGENAVFRLQDMPQTEANLKKAIEIVRLLVEKKTDFNMINKENMTPLYKFSTGRQPIKALDTKLKFLQALIDAGAKPGLKLKRDLPLLNAVLMKVLVGNPDHIQIAKLLIENGVPLNEKSKKDKECKSMTSVTENDTPLLIVIKREGFQQQDKTDMIKLLVENGAKTTARNKKRETPKKLVRHKSPYYDALYKTKVKKHSR